VKNRVSALIDSFNYYHKIEKYQKKYKKSVKRLDYRKLITSFLKEDDDVANAKIVYCSASAYFTGKYPAEKHQPFISALKYSNTEAVPGNFKAKKIRKYNIKEKYKECSVCHKGYLHR
jgi:hypothetical protein